MEADWSVESLADDPVIAIPWTSGGKDDCGFVDLRSAPDSLDKIVDEIREAKGSPILRSGLLRLNGCDSQFWTVKCDAWTSSPGQGDAPFDPYEMDGDPGQTAFGAGSYVDVLPRDASIRKCFATQERWLRAVVSRLRAEQAKSARADFVLRPAVVDGQPGFGVTWFVAGCGATPQRAGQSWAYAFEIALRIMLHTLL